ncbi:MAG: hypothetical protein KC549_18765 [Myxococcales bacterium]|nr:hypothetical protein [Myxococcales bacterium]MCB9549739.1 hypothetical protein [Myxococcales bacterium]
MITLLLIAALAAPPTSADTAPASLAAPASVAVEPSEAERFAAAEEALKAFEALHVTIPPGADMAAWSQAFSQGIQQQAQALGELQSRYLALAGASPQYAVPAFVRAGEVLEKFASELATLPPPSGGPEVAKALAGSLEQAANSLRQAAITYYQQALDHADRAGVTGEWPDFARERLARLRKP